jgi:HK97 family phage major capsid protein
MGRPFALGATVKELTEKLTAALVKARDLAAKAEKENREFTAEERQQLQGHLDEAKGYREQIKRLEGDDEMRKAIAELGLGIELGDGKKAGGPPVPAAAAERGKGIGQRFVEAPEFKDWLQRVAPGGHIPESAKGLISPPVQFKTLLTGLDDASAGAMVVTDRLPGILEYLRRPLAMRDIVTQGTTGSDTIEYVRVLSETNNAAPVAEATAAGGSSGVKPESGLAFQKVTETVKTIAHWIPATKRALSDAGQIRTIIDNFLMAGLEQKLEDEMVTGDGTGEHLTGIFNVSGVQTQAFDTNLLKTARVARRKVRTVGRAIPNAYLMHPIDWEAYDLLQDNEARYYFGGPMRMGTPTLWGLPVVECEAVTQGTAFVGDFRQFVLWDREQASIQVSDSHADFFIRNLVAFLAEMRAAFGCFRPSAIVKIALS